SGLAANSAEAAFSIGSRLAALEGGIVNQLLGGLLGSNITLSVMDYEALLSADVSLLSFLDALATELALASGSYSESLDANVSVGQIPKALPNADGLSGNEKSALARLAAQASGSGAPKLNLSRLIDIGKAGALTLEQIGADINVMEMV